MLAVLAGMIGVAGMIDVKAQRKIIHLDMDCFFAAVEMRDNPALIHIPIAIGGSRIQRGVIATCNYPARAFGVRSAMPTAEALKRCPQLTLVSGDMAKYRSVSQQILSIFHRYSAWVEPLSLDEAFLDVTDSTLFNGSATLLAQEIRQVVFNETGLTVSAGVAPNKFLAKIASDENKPDGLFVIPPSAVADFVSQLPLRKIPGVGQKTAERLARYNLHFCRELAQVELKWLITEFGSLADTLLKRCKGIDERPVKAERCRKSVGVEHTLPQDIQDYDSAALQLSELIPKLQRRLDNIQGPTLLQKIGIKLKFSDFRQTTVETQSTALDCTVLKQLLNQAWQRRQQQGVRLIGIQAGLKQQCEEQLVLPFF